MAIPGTITLLGAQHPVSLPSFGTREDLVLAWGKHGNDLETNARRVYAAAVGACTGIGAQAKASVSGSQYDVLAYGDRVYSYLREQGASVADIVEAGAPLLTAMAEALFPRASEVEEAVGFSEGGAARQTSPPSDSASATDAAICAGMSG